MLIGAPQVPARPPKLAIAAAVVAFLISLVILISAFQVVLLVFLALVPAAAGVSILRKRIWGAYGFALFELAQATIAPLALLTVSGIPNAKIFLSIGLGLGLAVFFFLAGRSLAAMGAERGAVLPWIAVSLLFTVPLFFFKAFVIPTTSMEDTLLQGDKIIVRTSPRPTPARGDIIVFRFPVDRSQTSVKRVIGATGDHIKLVNDVVLRNGVELHEPYVVHKMQFQNSYAENFPSERPQLMGKLDSFVRDIFEHYIVNGELVVPPGKYFVLGDNRDNSLDSRFFGLVDASDIVGKPLFIYASEVPKEDLGPNTAVLQRVRWNRIFKRL
jgi:signal peptidase I